MPAAEPIPGEQYVEFGRALDAFRETKAFADEMAKVVGKPGKFVVLTEGETDPTYLRTAAELLGRGPLLDKVDFEWVGTKHPETGQAMFTGKDALNQALAFLRAKPGWVRRRIALLYDKDANKSAEDHGLVHVRSLPKNPNGRIQVGIENLLASEAISDQMYREEQIPRKDGGSAVIRSLEKTKLCDYVCHNRKIASDFVNFAEVLDAIEELAHRDAQTNDPR